MDRFRCLSIWLLVVLLVSGCVKIETGPETAEQQAESAGYEGKQFRVDWVDRFTGLPPVEKTDMVRGLVDSLSTRFIRYGYTVADQWREGNAGRGQQIPGSEMRDVIAQWNQTGQPLIEAYEDVLEYSLAEIRDSRFFDDDGLALVRKHIDLYYTVHSAVFYPSGTLDDYEIRLAELSGEVERQSRELATEMGRY